LKTVSRNLKLLLFYNEGWLIDFDFGGKLTSNLTYPIGYKQVLKDGTGISMGVGGKPIRKCDDWYALLKLIFGIHTIDYGDREDEEVIRLHFFITKFTQKWLSYNLLLPL
jgi:hypothetical protein